jgi:hypothetical protein
MWAWIKSALGFGGCDHEWFDCGTFIADMKHKPCRKCAKCGRLEMFQPDVGGWTSGHWDEVK